MTITSEIQTLIDRLGLVPHPEGGYYRETYRALLSVTDIPHGSARAVATAIYYLLPAGTLSALHRVTSDEVWHHYGGDPVELHTIDPSGIHVVTKLGSDLSAGELPQHVVFAGVWQAAIPMGRRYSLCGCTVSPGFDFSDFEMPSREQLLKLFPAHTTLVTKLTRG